MRLRGLSVLPAPRLPTRAPGGSVGGVRVRAPTGAVSLRELVSCMTEAREPTLKEDAMNIERKILRLNESLIELDDHVRTLEETVSGEIYELRMSLRRLETKLCADGAGQSAPFSVGNASKVDEMMARLEKLTRIVGGSASGSAPPPVPMLRTAVYPTNPPSQMLMLCWRAPVA